MLVLLSLACKKPDPPPVEDDPGPCVLETTQYATGEATRTRHLACGEALLDDFRVLGEGTWKLDLFSDGQRIIPALTTEGGDGVFRGLHMKGQWLVEGEGPLRVWGQGFTSDDDPGVIEAATLTLDADGLPVGGSPGTSWWAGVAGRAEGPAVLVGAHSSLQTTFRAGFDASGELHALWDASAEEVTVREGFILYLDPLWMGVGPDPAELWQAWSDAVVAGHPEPAGPPPLALRVEAASEDDVLAALVGLSDAPEVEAILVVPSWTVAPDLAALAAAIDAEGLVPGLALPASAAEVEARVGEGWGLFELDLAGAADAGTVAYRSLLEEVGRAAGDAWLIADAAPLLPSVGLVHGWRAGPTAAWANGKLWFNDPGPIGQGSGELVRALVVGGAWTVEDAAVLAPEILSERTGAAAAEDALKEPGLPTTWRLGSDLVALLNLSDSTREVSGPGGVEVLTGEQAEPGLRTLAPGAGELWRQAR